MKSRDQQLLEEAYRKVKPEPIPPEERERLYKLINSPDVEDDPTFIGYRGVSLKELDFMKKSRQVLPSEVPLVEDNEVLREVIGSAYYDMSDRQILKWVKDTLPWTFSKKDKSVNLTKDFQNAKGYGEAVIAVGCTGPYVHLGKGYVLAKDVNDCKILKVFN